MARTPPRTASLMAATREAEADFGNQAEINRLCDVMNGLKRDIVQQLELVMQRELEEVKASVRAIHLRVSGENFESEELDHNDVEKKPYVEATIKIEDQVLSDHELMESINSVNSEAVLGPPVLPASPIKMSEIDAILSDSEVYGKDDILRAVSQGSTNTLQSYLDKKLDPNQILQDVKLRGQSKNFTHCSLLALAVLAGRRPHVNLLINKGASVDNSTYGFLAGALQTPWSGPAVTATLIKNDIPILKLLIEKKADLATEASNGANFIWQCAYFGKYEMLELCLSSADVSEYALGKAAESANEVGVTYTPLHISVVMGQEDCSRLLLASKAQANTANEDSHTPLGTAIRNCRPELVTLLVKEGAQVAHVEEESSKHSRGPLVGGGFATALRRLSHLSGNSRNSNDLGFTDGVESLFANERNPVLVLAVALGLQSQPKQVEAINARAILEFCSTDTTCMAAMLEAMFAERHMRFRSKDVSRAIRDRKTAIVLKSECLNNMYVYSHPITVSSSYTHNEISGGGNVVPDDRMKKFINRITPQHLRDVKGSTPCSKRFHEYCHVPIGVHECLVPAIHHDLRFLKIIADIDALDDIFLNPHCQAIITHTWAKCWKMAVIDCLSHIMQLVFFAYVAVSRNTIGVRGLRPGLREYDEITSNVQWAAVMILPFWFFGFITEFVQFAVHIQYGWTHEYLSIFNLVDVSRILADGAMICCFLSGGFSATEDLYFRLFLGAVCALKWSKMLYCLTPFRRIGLPVLPILYTLGHILPSVAIMFVYYSGFAHGLIALDVLPYRYSYTILHSVHFGVNSANLGAFDAMSNPNHLEDVKTWWLQLLLVLASFGLPITFMNIFIAAMSNSYEHGITCMEQLYQKRRVEASFVQSCQASFIQKKWSLSHRGDRPERLWYCRERSDSSPGN